MLRTDGTTRLTASSLPEIHDLVMSLHYTRVEIKTAHSLESWNGGVLVMVTGSVHSKDFSGMRKFVETFFLAPQDKGYFVLNNIFHIIDNEPLYCPSVSCLGQTDQGYMSKASATVPKPASESVVGFKTRVWDCLSPASPLENGPADQYNFSEQQLRQIYEAKSILESSYIQSNASFRSSVKSIPTQLSPPAEEFTGEPQRHTYASIVTKKQSERQTPALTPFRKSTTAVSEWDHDTESPAQQSVSSSTATEKFRHAAVEVSTMEGEMNSVYVRNLPTTVTPFQIEEAFKKFGRLKSNEGVFIKSREDVGFCYAFVEFEDASSVQNAIKASKIEIAGRQVFIEGRRPDGVIAYRGRGKGRGKVRHSTEASVGNFAGRGFGRGKTFYREVSH